MSLSSLIDCIHIETDTFNMFTVQFSSMVSHACADADADVDAVVDVYMWLVGNLLLSLAVVAVELSVFMRCMHVKQAFIYSSTRRFVYFGEMKGKNRLPGRIFLRIYFEIAKHWR